MKYRAVIYAKAIIVEDSAKAFHEAVAQCLEELENDGQQYGWCAVDVAGEGDEIPDFPAPSREYV